MVSSRRASSANVWLALGIVYVVWGSTYLAIAIAVQTLPPLFYSGVRFAIAGLILAGWLALRGVDLRISRRELVQDAHLGQGERTPQVALVEHPDAARVQAVELAHRRHAPGQRTSHMARIVDSVNYFRRRNTARSCEK